MKHTTYFWYILCALSCTGVTRLTAVFSDINSFSLAPDDIAPQAVTVEEQFADARTFARRMPIYDLANTIDIIYAVPATTAVVDSHTRYTMNPDTALVATEDQQKTVFFVCMDGEKSERFFTLHCNGKAYHPEKIRPITETYWLALVCGEKTMRFKKNMCAVIFDLPAVYAQPYSLSISTGTHDCCIGWNGEAQ